MASLLTDNLTRWRGDARRVASVSVCTCVGALLLWAGSGWNDGRVERSPAGANTRLSEARVSGDVTFRLGNAARPFGWSTVIGDFNTDGRPDIAVVDHVGRLASQYAYRIDFALSGQTAEDLTFQSTHDAVTITAADIDRDQDLDVIVTLPISGETVGIWLNDGHGHFNGAHGRQFPAASQAQHTIRNAGPPNQLASVDSPRRRWHDGVPGAIHRLAVTPCSLATFSREHSDRSSSALAQIAPRGPPNPPGEFSS
jgi:FG-GAP-like repeat